MILWRTSPGGLRWAPRINVIHWVIDTLNVVSQSVAVYNALSKIMCVRIFLPVSQLSTYHPHGYGILIIKCLVLVNFDAKNFWRLKSWLVLCSWLVVRVYHEMIPLLFLIVYIEFPCVYLLLDFCTVQLACFLQFCQVCLLPVNRTAQSSAFCRSVRSGFHSSCLSFRFYKSHSQFCLLLWRQTMIR